jgi:NTP pyrophosphatase (non-canonical NTP hydrolase)
MELSQIRERAATIRKLYEKHEEKKYGRSWTDEEITLGFVGDVGDLVKLVQAKNGVRDISDVDAKIEHELSDCLWSIFVLAEMYGINIEKAFVETMDGLEKRLNS